MVKVRVVMLVFLGLMLASPVLLAPVAGPGAPTCNQALATPLPEWNSYSHTYSNHLCTGAPRDC